MIKLFTRMIHELILTLSNKPSLLSSKRLERFSLFSSGLIFYYWYFSQHYTAMDAYAFAIFVAPIFGYAGFNTVKIQKDVKDKVDERSQEAAQ